MRKFWAGLMILCFGVLDAVSTVFVYRQVGSFDYELGLIPSFLYHLGDIGAVVIVKLVLTIIAAILLYYTALNVPRLDRLCVLICIGASIVGLFAAATNVSGALTGSTLFILGLRGDWVAYIIFTLFFVLGIVDLVFNSPDRKSKIGKKA